MTTIVTRAGKGLPLTHNEVDANFNNLTSDKVEVSALGTAAYAADTDFAAASHTHTLSDITDAGTAAAANTTDFDAAGTALALAIALG